jgi:hypothetical protein
MPNLWADVDLHPELSYGGRSRCYYEAGIAHLFTAPPVRTALGHIVCVFEIPKEYRRIRSPDSILAIQISFTELE